MALQFTVLGDPGRDNAVFVRVDSGQRVDRLLFDCGEGCLAALSIAEVQAIDHVCFSHCHMDHISGFDSFFRVTYDRTARPNHVWGPPGVQTPATAGTRQIIQHRFQGFLWNLYQEAAGSWEVHDIYPAHVETSRYQTNQAFAQAHLVQAQPRRSGLIIDTPEYSVQAFQMDHLAPSMAYLVREKPRLNIDPAKLAALGLRPGVWLQAVKTPQPEEAPALDIDGKTYPLADLRADLLTETPGQSLAYLTDFILNEQAQERLADALQGCTTIICESQYRQADSELATRNHHMTAAQVAELARRANARQVLLFHLSDRYTKEEWLDLLAEARAIFPNTAFPDGWLANEYH
jgi:ribonuclease Z